VDKHGFLQAEDAQTSHPFVIQWHRDGTNPGKLSSLLAKTRASLGQPNPVFPPGTRTFGIRNYLYLAHPVSWRDAVDLAKSAGGNLLVPGSIAETSNLEDMTKPLTAKNGIWLGGFLKGDHWVWITGEPWKTPKWADDADTTAANSALIIRPGKGWDTRDPAAPASGFIIEWSNDANSATPPEMESAAGPADETSSLIARAKELIVAADAKRSEALKDNTEKLSWDLDVFMRGLNRSNQNTWSPHVERLKLTVKANRVPSAVPKSSGIDLSPEMARLAEFHSLKQDKIDMQFAADAEKIRVAFVAKLKDAQTAATASGQPKVAESIGEAIEAAGDLASWVDSFGVTLEPENPVAGGSKSTTRETTPVTPPGIRTAPIE
jgi:hypothetical protein